MKRFWILLLCAAWLLPLAAASVPSYAADSYLITIAEDTVLEETADNGMAVYIDGIIYIPYTTVNASKSVYANYNAAEQMVTVFTVGADMCFELDTGLTYSRTQQRSVQVSAKLRDGVPYLPVSIVAAWMEMYFSFISSADSGVGYPVIRLASKKPVLEDQTVLSRSAAALRRVAAARDRASGITTPPVEELPQRTVSLLFTGLPEKTGEDEGALLPDLLEMLESYSLQAAFFAEEDRLAEEAEALRELYCRGHAVGILLTDGEAPLEQAQRCAELLGQALHIRVRTVCASGLTLTDVQKTQLAENGFVLWEPTLEPYGEEMTAKRLNTGVRRALRGAPEQSSLQLRPDGVTMEALPLIYSYLVAQNFTVAPVREWTEPY